jgi:class 3 adenylate cyclase
VLAPTRAQEQTPLSYTPQYLTEKILAARPTLEGERKQVTVLFADMKDSTELIKDLDPETAQQLLDPALRHMMDAVDRFEGTVNQVLGDGIMALFGAPIAHEDHALRACYAALALQAAMQPYAEEVRRRHSVTLRIRVGLNAGEVVVRAIGNDLHMDYSAVGQTVHLAARMEQLAAPGSILLTAATLRLVEGLVRVNALGPLPVKGLTEGDDQRLGRIASYLCVSLCVPCRRIATWVSAPSTPGPLSASKRRPHCPPPSTSTAPRI